MTRSSPFTDAVVTATRKLYPEELADTSFDNTGLLLQAPFQSQAPRNANSVLLTIDLTTAVADEAIKGNHSVVVAYHPIIFRGLKSITLDNTQQASLLRLAAKGVSVYSPHTAVDITPGGMGDWLCDLVTGKKHDSESEAVQKSTDDSSKPKSQSDSTPFTLSHITPPESPTFDSEVIPHDRSVITPSPSSHIQSAKHDQEHSVLNSASPPYAADNTGSGRLISFKRPQPLSKLITRITASLGNPRAFQLAIPQTETIDTITISTVGVCPGSGSSVLSKASPAPDLLFTGELSHHEALAAIERGGCVITLNHSNSERGYLNGVMKSALKQQVTEEWTKIRKEMNEGKVEGERLREMLEDESVDVVVSKVDRDPFGTLVFD